MKNHVLKIGLLGCGPISQFAHLPAFDRARGVQLTALCDAAEDLLEAVGRRSGIDSLFTNHKEFLARADMDAVLIAVSDPFHMPLVRDSLEAGKHVLVEKPLGTNSRECAEAVELVNRTGLKLQVGSMKRHDPGIDFAHQFIKERVGEILSVSGWYCDTLFRTAMQQALLPTPLTSERSLKSPNDPRADKQHYSLVTHGAHLFDNLRYLGGEISAVTVKVVNVFDQYSWHGLIELVGGGLGHFELTIKQNCDWSEGYKVQGSGGGVEVRTFLPFYNRPSEVRAFDASTEQWHTPLGAHSNPYKRQLEAFARSVLDDEPTNPDVLDGLAAVRLLEAVEESTIQDKRVEIAFDQG